MAVFQILFLVIVLIACLAVIVFGNLYIRNRDQKKRRSITSNLSEIYKKIDPLRIDKRSAKKQ